MKKKLLLVSALVVMLLSLFAIAVSAETPAMYIEFEVLFDGDTEYTKVYSTNDFDTWTPKISLARDFYLEPEQTNLVDKTKIVKIDMSGATPYGTNNKTVKQVGAPTDATQFANVTEIKFPVYSGNFTAISNSTCKDWVSLRTVDFGTATSIGDNAFENCTFTEFTVPSQIVQFNNGAFKGCASLQKLTVEGNANFGGGVFQDCTSLTDVNLVNPKLIGSSMFNGCTSLTEITIPEGATEIGAMAFYGTSLTSLYVPASVTKIGYQVVEDVKSFTSLTFAPNSKLTFIAHRTFQNSGLTGDLVIPEGVTQIDYSAFTNTQITSVKLPSTLTKLGRDANGSSVFSGCTSLASINLPSGLTGLWPSTFNGCSSLTSIHIPASVTYIGNNCFDSCTSLSTVTFEMEGALLEKVGAHGFQKTAIKEIVFPNSLLRIGQSTFNGCSNLESVNFGASFVDFDANNASQPPFANGSTLKYVYLSDTFNGVRNYIFSWNDNNANEYNNQYLNLTFLFTGTEAQAKAIINTAKTGGTDGAVLNTYIATMTLISAEDYAKAVAEGTLVTGVNGAPARYMVYNYSKCKAFYNDNHINKEELVYGDNMYFENANICTVCTRCPVTDVKQTIAPLFKSLGYSYSSNAIMQGFGVNYTVLAEYEAFYEGKEISFGLIATTFANAEDGMLINAEKKAQVDLTTKGYDIFEMKITGIGSENQATSLFLCGYITVGDKTYYLSVGKCNESALDFATSYESVSASGATKIE